MTEQVVAEGKRFADIASCLAKQGDGTREYLEARKEGEDTQKQVMEEMKSTPGRRCIKRICQSEH